MPREITVKKKDQYPSKTTLNLYCKVDKTTRPATAALYILFGLVVLLALAKVAIYDPVMELRDLQEAVAQKENQLASQMAYLENYEEVASQYARYSYSYLTEEEMLRDRIEVLDMLEDTVFAASTLDSVTVVDNVLTIRFFGPDLREAAALAREIESYEFVNYVTVNTASLNPDRTGEALLVTTMIIDLVPAEVGGDAQ